MVFRIRQCLHLVRKYSAIRTWIFHLHDFPNLIKTSQHCLCLPGTNPTNSMLEGKHPCSQVQISCHIPVSWDDFCDDFYSFRGERKCFTWFDWPTLDISLDPLRTAKHQSPDHLDHPFLYYFSSSRCFWRGEDQKLCTAFRKWPSHESLERRHQGTAQLYQHASWLLKAPICLCPKARGLFRKTNANQSPQVFLWAESLRSPGGVLTH